MSTNQEGAYRPILDAKPEGEPEAPEWDGEGELPPINHRCEMARAGESYTPGALRYIGNDLIVWQFEGGHEYAMRPEHCKFRPIRSEEDRAVDEMVSSLPPSMQSALSRIVCTQLYDKGYRKQ